MLMLLRSSPNVSEHIETKEVEGSNTFCIPPMLLWPKLFTLEGNSSFHILDLLEFASTNSKALSPIDFTLFGSVMSDSEEQQ